ncbi:MAG: DUF6159 family protein [Halobacteriota archaeon]
MVRFMERLRRGITLTVDSIHVLREYPRLTLFPLVSAVVGVAFLGLFSSVMLGTMVVRPEGGVLVVLFVVYLALTFVSTFFTAGLVHQTRHALEGGTPSLVAGVTAAWRAKSRLVVWAMIASTVGVLINGVENSNARGGRIFGALFGFAWTLMTFFIVPVIVFEETGVGGMFSRSLETFKQTWGETPVSMVGVQLISVVVGLPLFLIGLMLFSAQPLVGVGVILVGVVFTFLVVQTLEGIIKTTLYLYATEGKRPSEFDDVDFEALAS